MREYDNETLTKVQKAELGILRDFVDLCEKNNLTYFGIAGTGIGAIRHGGFIPWDDDKIGRASCRERVYTIV